VTALLDVMAVRATGDPGAAVVECGAPGPGIEETRCDVLVVGGGTGGTAAALAAARAGRRVYLLEETDWIGGQLTSQGVSALDEHEHIERFGELEATTPCARPSRLLPPRRIATPSPRSLIEPRPVLGPPGS
jgi:flavin-dependent dehydrogenase